MTYFNAETSELLKVISQDDLEFVLNTRIPYHGSNGGLWARKYFIDERISQAIERGEIKQIEHEPVKPVRAGFYAQSDYVPNGEIKSMVDGKTYDSKSKYYKSVKEAGLHVIGNDNPVSTPAKIDSDITGKDIKNAIERIRAR